ncbi:MAG: hypothetical protein AAF206_25830 [Bacteroidota bacterium]
MLLGDDILAGDATNYHNNALQIRWGEHFGPYWPPALPYYLAGWIWLLGGANWVMTLAMLCLYAAFFFLLHTLLPTHFKQSQQAIIHGLFAIYPGFIHHAVSPLSQLMAAVLLLLVWTGVRQEKIRWWLGIPLGVLILLRPSSLVLVALVWLWLIWQRKWLGLVVSAAIVCLMIGGWVLRAHQMTDRWIWINDANGYNFWLGNNPQTPLYKSWWLGSHDESDDPQMAVFYQTRDSIKNLPPARHASSFSQKARAHIQDQPGLFVLRSLNRIRVFFAFNTYVGGSWQGKNRWLAMLLLGLDALCYLLLMSGWILFWQNKRLHWMILATVLAYALPYFLAFSHPNYHLPLMGLIALATVNDWTDMSRKKLISQIKKRWLLLLLLGLIQLEWVWWMMG